MCSGGLSPTGGSNAGCSSSTGQVYARSASFNNAFAIMYAWYMPKVRNACHRGVNQKLTFALAQDSPSTGLGHRHDWERIVVWLDNLNEAEPTIP